MVKLLLRLRKFILAKDTNFISLSFFLKGFCTDFKSQIRINTSGSAVFINPREMELNKVLNINLIHHFYINYR
jgi:hypothetical protein